MNFIEDAVKTKSLQYHGDKVSKTFVNETLVRVLDDLADLDAIKKKLFYNKGQDVTGDPLSDYTQKELDVMHGIIGIATEAGELLEQLFAFLFYNDEFDEVNIKEELGDIFWYQALLAKNLGFTFEEIQDTVLKKLKHRYPDSFTSEAAINRDLDGERKILEG